MDQSQARITCGQCNKIYINPGPLIPRTQMRMARNGFVCTHCGVFYCDICTTRKIEYEHQEFLCKCGKAAANMDENFRIVKNGFKEIMVFRVS